VVSGNVSFYNETNGSAVQPTPAIGAVGLIDDLERTARPALATAGDRLIVIGDTSGHLGASLYAREIHGTEAGAPPPVDLAAERRNGDFVRDLITAGQVTVCHDIADGGLLVAVTEMALAGDLGATLDALPTGAVAHGWLFGEDQARYVIAVDEAGAEAVIAKAQAAGVPAQIIGEVGGDALTVLGENPISLAALRTAHENWLPDYMAAE